MTTLFRQRFNELEQQLAEIESSTSVRRGANASNPERTNSSDLILNWSVKARSLLERVCGEQSSHIKMYLEAEQFTTFDSHVTQLQRMKAVFLAAKEDFEGGYLNSLRNLVQAEVFSSELEQADELLRSGYATAAAVIAGVVLETALRDMCTARSIDHGKLNKMNDDLAKAGAYNAARKHRITALAAIRNHAAHGRPEEFTSAEVKGMIEDVERFLAAQL